MRSTQERCSDQDEHFRKGSWDPTAMTATGAGVGTQNNFKGPGRPTTWTRSSLLGTSSYKPNSTGLWYFPSISDMEEPRLLLEKVMLIKTKH